LPALLHRASNRPYKAVKVDGDVATIDPPLEAVSGVSYPIDDPFDLLDRFTPFDPSHRDEQQHELYIGSESLLNLPAPATIEVSGLSGDYQWSYWGKSAEPSNPAWQPLTPPDKRGGIKLNKGAGSVEVLMLNGKPSRWLKATAGARANTDALQISKLTLKVNSSGCTDKIPCPPGSGQKSTVTVEGIANTTPLVFDQAFYPLGQQPRLFDAFYLASPEAFSKPDACVKICLEALDATAQAFTATDSGAGPMLLWVGADGYLHRMGQLASVSSVTRLKSVRPPINSDGTSTLGQTPIQLTQATPRLSVVSAAGVAVAALIAGQDIWLWIEDGTNGTWEQLKPLPDSSQGEILQVLILRDGTQKRIVALVGDDVFEAGWSKGNPGPWTRVGTDKWKRIAPVFNKLSALTGGSFADGWIAVSSTGASAYFETKTAASGTTSSDKKFTIGVDKIDWAVTPLAVLDGAQFLLVAQLKGLPTKNLSAWNVPVSGGAPAKLESVSSKLVDNAEFDWAVTASNGITVLFAEQYSQGAERINAWFPQAPAGGAKPDVLYPSPSFADVAGSPSVVVAKKMMFAPAAKGAIIAMSFAPDALQEFVISKASAATAVLLSDPTLQPQAGDVFGIQYASSMNVFAEDVSSPPIPIPDSSQTWLEVPKSGDDKGISSVDFYRPDPLLLDGKVKSVPNSTITLDGRDAHPDNTFMIRVKPPAGDATIHSLTISTSGGGTEAVVSPKIPGLSSGDSFAYSYLAPLISNAGPLRPLIKPPAAACTSMLQYGAFLLGADPWPNPVRATDPHAVPFTRAVLSLPWNTLPQRSAAGFSLWRNDIFGSPNVIADAKAANPALSWEYFDGQSWWKIDNLHDGTANLRSTGIVQFCVPLGLAQTEVAGRKSYWIRARLVGGDYGSETVSISTIQDPAHPGGTIQTVTHSSNGAPPILASINVYYSQCLAVEPDYVLTKDGGILRDQTVANGSDNAKVEAFLSLHDSLARLTLDGSDAAVDDPALYVGFDASFSGGPIGILFLVKEDPNGGGAYPLQVEALLAEGFEPVVAEDNTRGLNESGTLVFDLSTPPLKASLFGPNARYWIRLRPKRGFSGKWNPQIFGAYLNAVFATASQTHVNERLGSSDGSPNQKVQLVFPPVLDGSLELRVREPLSDDEANALNAKEQDAAEPASSTLASPGEAQGYWVKWAPVIDIGVAGPTDRSYTLDDETGEIVFGDGKLGRIPSIGANSIVAVSYKTMGGDAANRVVAWSKANLASQVPGVDTVLIPQAAAGGAGPQSPDEVLRFAPSNQFSRHRALTLSDFESLAMQSSRDIAQARAFTTSKGMKVVVVFRGEDPQPNQSQIRELQRSLLGYATPDLAGDQALVIAGSRSVDLKLSLSLAIDSIEASGSVSGDVTTKIRELLDPATGGFDSYGWPLGEWPDNADIAAQLSEVDSLEEILEIKLEFFNQGASVTQTAVDLPRLAPEGIHFDIHVPSLETAQ
jgi:hypothetical protein